MNLTLSMATIGLMSDGIILLDQKGRPREVNAAAHPWLRRCVELTPQWVLGIEQMQARPEYLPPVVKFDSAGDGLPPADVQLVKNGNQGYALLIRPLAALGQAASKSQKKGFLSLLGGEVRREIAAFTTLLHQRHDFVAQSADLMRQADRVVMLLADVDALAELDQHDEVFADQRIAIAALVRGILPTLPRATGDGAIRYALVESGEKLAPVYGNQKWLTKALHALLARLGRSCPEHGRVVIDLRQIGDFVVLNVRATTDPAGWYVVPAAAEETVLENDLRAAIVHRIIALHGGQLKLRFIDKEANPEEADAAGAIESITLALPTGVPLGDRSRVSCSECRITLQAMQYARDLAEIMAGGAVANNSAKEASHDHNSARR
jgi:hypothetical protein